MRALIIGRARGVWEETQFALRTVPFDLVIAINRAGCHFPGQVHHWASYHGYYFEQWIELRRLNGYPEVKNFWTSSYGRRVCAWEKRVKPNKLDLGDGGSSGLLGVLAADFLGADEIVLAGIPMDPTAGHYDEDGPWMEAMTFRAPWTQLTMASKIKSMSGWTRTTFGAPDWATELRDPCCPQPPTTPGKGM